MKPFGTWFRDFFLDSLSFEGREKKPIDIEIVKVRLSWLFGSSLYLSIACFCIYIVGLSAIHLSAQIKDALWIEKILFFISPKVWQNYFFSGTLFNSLRRASNAGEITFIFLNLGLVIISFISLIFNLYTINISWSTNLKELRLACYALCFPVFGWLFTLSVIGYFKFMRSKDVIISWLRGRDSMHSFWDKASEIVEKVGTGKDKFKPKTLDFLEIKKENKVSEMLSRLDKYVVKKI
ncbi:hypothetical protein OVS_01030 [Mycoplasma ovis str. Michigan]|uniref:Uncharacterized protein n=1 Tax=Mycoplasma ovis str. Michigan TaxID=1415773 RepID=A0ABN4BLB3_9MOLU|nr:hypothetical protein [Mycoplasma ovis]AHC40170.1 hypothetical protein OVS_01030 [Mycoplasma ovis str. Michigan]